MGILLDGCFVQTNSYLGCYDIQFLLLAAIVAKIISCSDIITGVMRFSFFMILSVRFIFYFMYFMFSLMLSQQIPIQV